MTLTMIVILFLLFLISLVSFEKIYQTLKTVFKLATFPKNLEVHQKYSAALSSLSVVKRDLSFDILLKSERCHAHSYSYFKAIISPQEAEDSFLG